MSVQEGDLGLDAAPRTWFVTRTFQSVGRSKKDSDRRTSCRCVRHSARTCSHARTGAEMRLAPGSTDGTSPTRQSLRPYVEHFSARCPCGQLSPSRRLRSRGESESSRRKTDQAHPCLRFLSALP